jgi:hypothetical protein
MSTRHAALWEAMVTPPFVTDMGDGAMPVAKFRDYFIQDFVFVRDLVKMVAENFEVARICVGDRSESLSGGRAGPGGRPVRDGVHIKWTSQKSSTPPIRRHR